jgi:signal transduction histidine kinase
MLRPGAGHFGLANLHDRAAAVGGDLEIDSEPGRGTRIIVRLPLTPSENPAQ